MKIVKIMGGLGNQMFQYAFARALQERFQCEVLLDTSFYAPEIENGEFPRPFLLQNYNITLKIATPKDIKLCTLRGSLLPKPLRKYFCEHIKESEDSARIYDEALLRQTRKNAFYEGYFQSAKYFAPILEDLRKELTLKVGIDSNQSNRVAESTIRDISPTARTSAAFAHTCKYDKTCHSERSEESSSTGRAKRNEAGAELKRDSLPQDDTNGIDSKNMEILAQIKSCNAVSVHIRRGDYVALGCALCDVEYYKRAISYIRKRVKNPCYFLFSDDSVWLRENARELGAERFFIIEHNPQEKAHYDLELMRACKYNIIANSTFSLWGGALNENPQKIIIAPKGWSYDFDVEVM